MGTKCGLLIATYVLYLRSVEKVIPNLDVPGGM